MSTSQVREDRDNQVAEFERRQLNVLNNNPALMDYIRAYAEKKGFEIDLDTPEQIIDFLKKPGIVENLTTAIMEDPATTHSGYLTQIREIVKGEIRTDNVQDAAAPDVLVDALGATPEQQEAFEDATGIWGAIKGYFTGAAGDPHQIISDMINENNISPDQLLTALETAYPDSKEFIDVIRQDEDLKNAVHNAMGKDKTVLEGLGSLMGKDGAFKPEQLQEMLKDPQTRELIVGMLNGVAENDKITFKEFADTLNAGADFAKNPMDAEKRKKYREQLANFGLTDGREESLRMLDDPMAMLQKFWNDPQGFVQDLIPLIKQFIPEEYQAVVIGGLNSVLPMLSGFTNPQGDGLGHYVQGFGNIGRTAWNNAGEEGQKLLAQADGNAPAQSGGGATTTPPASNAEPPVQTSSVNLPGVRYGTGSTGTGLAGDNGNVQMANLDVNSVFNGNASGNRTDGYTTPEELVQQANNLRGGAHVMPDRIAAGPVMTG